MASNTSKLGLLKKDPVEDAFDTFNIKTMLNDNWDKIDGHARDYVSHSNYVVASGTNTYSATIEGLSLLEGVSIKVKFTNANTGASTLNINGLGAKTIKKSNGNDLSSGNIKAGQICHLVYTGANFQLLGEGGEYGTATASDVLTGKTIGTEAGLINGSMPNNGAVTSSLDAGGSYTIPKGYHDGAGKVTANSLASQTIATATASQLLSGQTAWVNGSKITGTIPSKAAATITPGTTNQTIAANQYLSGVQTILGDPDLVPANIVSGKNVFGVAGTATVESLGGRPYATGNMNTSTSTEAFKISSSGYTQMYRVYVSGLSFTPTLIILRYSQYYSMYVVGDTWKYYGSDTSNDVWAEGMGAVGYGYFGAPVPYAWIDGGVSRTDYEWYAIG